jgi:hypothetical protein
MSRGIARLLGCSATTVALAAAVPSPAGATTTTRAPAAPVKASMTLYLPDAFFVHREPLMVPGRTLHVGGVVRPYVPGQWVTVRAAIGGHVIKTDRLRVKPSPSRRYGRFTESLATQSTGSVVVSVEHRETAQVKTFGAQRSYTVLDTSAGFGSTGRLVQLIQQQLASLHFYIEQTGVYDPQTGWALDAYHRLLGWGTSQSLDHRTLTWLLNGWGDFKVRYPNQGKHVEGTLSKQLIALIYGSNVYRIYPISSGKPSTPTVLGSFQVWSKAPGYLSDGMYFSNFFFRGYAIHGYDPAPDYPASHGCIRLPIGDAISVYDWLNIGDRVDVYD